MIDPKEWPRLAISIAIVALFALMLFFDPRNQLLQGALIAQFANAAQYWLGSSKSSTDNAARADKALAVAQAATGP